jgi:hypothetical protein
MSLIPPPATQQAKATSGNGQGYGEAAARSVTPFALPVASSLSATSSKSRAARKSAVRVLGLLSEKAIARNARALFL